jgi:methionine-rich copper-binding protein CopC
MRNIVIALVAAIALALPLREAMAHAHLKRANPRVGATIKEAPPVLQLWFTEALEPSFTKLELQDAAGKPVAAAGELRVSTEDRTLLELPLPKLPAGKYKVIWHAVSVDTHVTDGDFAFTVAP